MKRSDRLPDLEWSAVIKLRVAGLLILGLVATFFYRVAAIEAAKIGSHEDWTPVLLTGATLVGAAVMSWDSYKRIRRAEPPLSLPREESAKRKSPALAPLVGITILLGAVIQGLPSLRSTVFAMGGGFFGSFAVLQVIDVAVRARRRRGSDRSSTHGP